MLQLRLANPAPSELFTSPSPPTGLLERIPAQPGNKVTICNLPLEPNRLQLWRLLVNGVEVRLYDQSFTEERILHPRLIVTIDSSAGLSTSQIVDISLGGVYRRWALVGAFGRSGRMISDLFAHSLALTHIQRVHLQTLGELITYNANIADPCYRCIEPAALYAALSKYQDPLNFFESEPVASELEAMRKDDLQNALALQPYWTDNYANVYVLPDVPWGHRATNGLNTQLATLAPHKANAVIGPARDGYVRATVHAVAKFGVEACTRRWLVERLPVSELDQFINACCAARWGALRTPVLRAWQ